MSEAATQRLQDLEYRFELSRLAYQQLAAQVAGLASQLANLQLGQLQQPGGGGGVTYMVMAPTAAITAGLSTPLTGQTVVVISGAANVTVSTNATIFNNMASNTVSAKPLVVGPNNDGTFTVITQSC